MFSPFAFGRASMGFAIEKLPVKQMKTALAKVTSALSAAGIGQIECQSMFLWASSLLANASRYPGLPRITSACQIFAQRVFAFFHEDTIQRPCYLILAARKGHTCVSDTAIRWSRVIDN